MTYMNGMCHSDDCSQGRVESISARRARELEAKPGKRRGAGAGSAPPGKKSAGSTAGKVAVAGLALFGIVAMLGGRDRPTGAKTPAEAASGADRSAAQRNGPATTAEAPSEIRLPAGVTRHHGLCLAYHPGANAQDRNIRGVFTMNGADHGFTAGAGDLQMVYSFSDSSRKIENATLRLADGRAWNISLAGIDIADHGSPKDVGCGGAGFPIYDVPATGEILKWDGKVVYAGSCIYHEPRGLTSILRGSVSIGDRSEDLHLASGEEFFVAVKLEPFEEDPPVVIALDDGRVMADIPVGRMRFEQGAEASDIVCGDGGLPYYRIAG